MLRTAEAARALLGGDGPVIDFNFGIVASLRSAQVDESPGLESDALVLRVSTEFLAQSRRDGGLAHKFGVFEFEHLALGALFIAASKELHVVLLEPAIAECRALLGHVEASGYLHVLASAGDTDSRLMRIGRCDGLDMLCVAARNNRPGSTQEVAPTFIPLWVMRRYPLTATAGVRILVDPPRSVAFGGRSSAMAA